MSKKRKSSKKKRKAGTYCLKVGKIWRKVRILANGQWRFLKGSCKGKKKPKKR